MLINQLKKLLAKFSAKFHIRVVLIVPFIFQIIVAVGLTGYLSYRNGQQAVNSIVTQLHGEITARIQQYLHAYLDLPPLVVNLNANAIQNDELDLNQLHSWLPHLISQSQLFPELNYIYCGNEHGDYIALQRLEDGSLGYNI
ncbi:MAG: guanylate cyclase, partial [Pseudomonadota bacterium]|nr:guanylate cyclase [Pseudomonadota bacterium]